MASIFPPPAQTRLVTIIAQVDHGKTTMADSLIESNGIISERLAGTLRYLDSMEEEQRRGITMRTSAIGLSHTQKNAKGGENQKNMVIHLLDSPGHTDFAPEVSSALQSCDGALLVVDVVEGMCARTHQVLREAHRHQLVPILVLNKVDRLCLELRLTPTEAYLRLRGLLESVNAASAAILNSKKAQNGTTEEEELLWVFEPQKGNVVFGSALFGWGFTVPTLAKSLFRGKTLAIKPVMLKQFLFGDFKYNQEGKVLKWKGESDDLEPLFARFALQPIWNIYEGVAKASMVAGLGSELFKDGRSTGTKKSDSVKLKASNLQQVLIELQTGGTGPRIPASIDELQQILGRTGASTEESILSSLLRRYRPLSDAVLDSVCEHCPAPDVASSQVRTRALALTEPEAPTEEFKAIRQGVKDGSPQGPVVAYICKFLSTDRSHVRDSDIDSNSETLILGLARVLSGTLKNDVPYFCMGHKHSYGVEARQRSIRLYLLMGSSFVPVKEVPAGHLCAVYGLEDLQLKTITLCDSPYGMPLQGFDRGVRPLVKVSIEAVSAEDTCALEEGLLKLSLADAAVEVTATAKGERILACLGEIHLEQSILELETTFCGKKDIQLRISAPIVEFAETTEWFPQEEDYYGFLASNLAPLRQTKIPPYSDEEGIYLAQQGRMRVVLSGRSAAIGVRVVPLSNLVYKSLKSNILLDGSDDELSFLGKALGLPVKNINDLFSLLINQLMSVDESGNALLEAKGLHDKSCIRGVVSSGVHVIAKETQAKPGEYGNGEQLLSVAEKEFHAVEAQLRNPETSKCSTADSAAFTIWTSQMRGSADAGFQLGVRSGPICEEAVHGVLVIVETVEIALQNDGNDSFTPAKPLSGGMVVAALRQGIRCGLLSRPSRLMEGHLKLTLHSSLTGLGPLYAVLSKRRGKTLVESMVDGTELIRIEASIPQAESFGLATELLQKTSGEVTLPEMTFLNWERLDEDPFWIPTSLEEREDFGEIGMSGDSSTGIDNTAIKYIRRVRERKGLLVDSHKTVIAAEKQRTMKK